MDEEHPDRRHTREDTMDHATVATSRRMLPILVIVALVSMAFAPPAHATAPGPNGRVAYRVYFDDAHTRGAIFTIQPDGTGLVQLTHQGRVLLDTEPDWSSDGRWIV